MRCRLRRTGLICCLVAVTWGLGAQSSLGASAGTLTLSYSGALSVVENGTQIAASGAVIAPGTYQVAVVDNASDTTDPVHMFHLSGSGVNLLTDLVGGDDKSELFAETLAPNSTYTFQDDFEPALGTIVFRTSSTPAPVSSVSPAPTAGSGTPSGKSTANTAVVGSAIKPGPVRGSLAGVVTTNGAVTLTQHGKSIATLKSGRYRISVLDRSACSGFVVQELRKAGEAVTGASFVGKRSETIVLRPGQWFYHPTAAGKKTYFIVTG